MLTIATLFRNAAEKHPDRLAVAFQQRSFTYAEWYERADRLARGFHELGVRPTDRVGLFLRTSEATAVAYMACQLLGAVAVPMNFRLAPNEAMYLLRDAGARLLVFDDTVATAVAKVAASMAGLVLVGDGTDAHGAQSLEALIAAGPGLAGRVSAPRPEDVAALVYTSGTTGRPKGVIHTHANDVAIAMNCIMEYSLRADDVALHIAPLYHVGGMQAYFTPHLAVGAANVITTRYEPLATLEAIAAHRVTTLFAVPTQIQDMLSHPRFDAIDTKSLRMITTGGAALPAATMERVIDVFCPRIFNGYGMTEASLTLLLHPEDALTHLGSCGKPTLISECRIVAAQDAVDPDPPEVDVGVVGQLVVRGPQLTRGYWGNPAETSAKIRGGWLHTGDLFSRDAEGYYQFRGRADDMIVSGGENIYPREVEEVVSRCPGVREVAVVGLPDPRWGQAVAAFVVRHDPALSAEDVDAFCRESGDLAGYKRPRRIVFVDALPINPSGKVLRRELVTKYGTAEAA